MSEIIAYTTGTFDMFHIGHLNLLRGAKALCDKLIVGVSTDELVIKYKGKKPLISFKDRIEIVRAIKYVNIAVPQDNLDKTTVLENLKYNILIVGNDHYGEALWNILEDKLAKFEVKVVYLPYTNGISSTQLRERIMNV